MGLLPEQVRALTPADTVLVVQGWNAAHAPADQPPPAMSRERLDELKRMYPDV